MSIRGYAKARGAAPKSIRRAVQKRLIVLDAEGRTSMHLRMMSALPSKADIPSGLRNVGFGPEPDMAQSSIWIRSW